METTRIGLIFSSGIGVALVSKQRGGYGDREMWRDTEGRRDGQTATTICARMNCY